MVLTAQQPPEVPRGFLSFSRFYLSRSPAITVLPTVHFCCVQLRNPKGFISPHSLARLLGGTVFAEVLSEVFGR